MKSDRIDDEAVERLQFHYQKASGYHTIHADGALGGPTGRGYLSLTFYSERSVLPRRTSRPVLAEVEGQKTLGPEEREESLDGVMRQLEVTALLDVNAARELLIWLRRQVGVIENALEIPEDDRLGDPISKVPD